MRYDQKLDLRRVRSTLEDLYLGAKTDQWERPEVRKALWAAWDAAEKALEVIDIAPIAKEKTPA